MNHDFICYIIISTIKIPHRLKNNFRYNYIVILYNNIIFRFSFQIRCSDEHTPRSGSEKIHFFLLQIPHWFLHSVLFFFLFHLFFLQYVTNTLETAPRRIVFLLSRFLSLISHSYLVILEMKRYTSFTSRGIRKSLRVSRSYRFLFFFLVFVCFLNISRREYAGPPSPPFFLFFFCLFVCFFCFHLARFIEILD